MKTDQINEVQRYNKETGEFEKLDNLLDDEAFRLVSIFCSEEKVMLRTVEIENWMWNKQGIMHIQYD